MEPRPAMIGKSGKVGSIVRMKRNLGRKWRGGGGGMSEGASIAIHGLNAMVRQCQKASKHWRIPFFGKQWSIPKFVGVFTDSPQCGFSKIF